MINPTHNLEHIAEPLRPLAIAIDEINPDPNNAREHDTHSIDAIAASLRRFGQREPFVIREEGMTVTAGNGRLEAARALGWAHVAVVIIDDDEVTARGYAIADNRTGELAEWDKPILSKTIGDLQAAGIDATVTGYSIEEIDELIEAQRPAAPRGKPARSTQPDAGRGAPPPQPNPEASELPEGTLITLGDHRLIIGNPAHRGTVAALMGSAKADLVVSDPPRSDRIAVNAQGDTEPATDVLGQAIALAAEFSRPGACWYVTADQGREFLTTARAMGDIWRHTLAWVSQKLHLGHGDHHYRHVPILYGWVPGAAHQEPPDRKGSSVWEISPASGELEGTPVELYGRPIRNSTNQQDLILDPFAGAGGAIIAAEQLGRRAAVITTNPAEAEAIVARWQALSKSPAQATFPNGTTRTIEVNP